MLLSLIATIFYLFIRLNVFYNTIYIYIYISSAQCVYLVLNVKRILIWTNNGRGGGFIVSDYLTISGGFTDVVFVFVIGVKIAFTLLHCIFLKFFFIIRLIV